MRENMKIIRVPALPDNVCEEHGVWDVLPCAWLNCRNGHEEERFQTRPLIEGKPPTTYTRRQWVSPLGGHYYSWDGNDLPNWFSAPKTFWNEARRWGLIGTSHPRLIYHYTSLEGFVGIAQSRALWLSDYSYLNDKRELTHGVEMVRQIIEEMLLAEPHSTVIDLLQTWKRDVSTPTHRVCIASFSADDDNLSQWRAYGPIAIGIEPQHLPMHANQTNLHAVEYDRGVQHKLASVYLSHLTQAYKTDLAADRLERIPDVYHKTDRLIELAAFFKDPAFRTEHEYRLAYIEYPETLRGLRLQSPPKKFRVSRSRLQPYVSSDELFPLPGQRTPLEISQVVLGPEADELLERGIREFLCSCGMPEVKVRRSTVPYRT